MAAQTLTASSPLSSLPPSLPLSRVTTMSHTSFDLPDEILAVIPTDPYEQLDLARKVTCLAITSRVSALESEAARLHHTIADRDRLIAELQDTLRITLQENLKLSRERDSQAAASKKLSHGLAKQAETVDIGTYNQSTVEISPSKEEGSLRRTASDKVDGSTDIVDSVHEGSSGYKLSISPYITPCLTPVASPKTSSTGGSPRGLSTGGTSPSITSGTSSPSKSRFELHSRLSSLYPSSQHSSATSSPPRRRSSQGRTRIDGKEFFRQARSHLSYEQFGAFLANIKQLNAQRQSREETLEKAHEIFGAENKDLYLSFQGLLGHSLH